MAFDPSGCAAPAFTPQVREVRVTDEIDEARELRLPHCIAGTRRPFIDTHGFSPALRHTPPTSHRMCSSSC